MDVGVTTILEQQTDHVRVLKLVVGLLLGQLSSIVEGSLALCVGSVDQHGGVYRGLVLADKPEQLICHLPVTVPHCYVQWRLSCLLNNLDIIVFISVFLF